MPAPSLVSGLQSRGWQKCDKCAGALGKPLRFSGHWVWGEEAIDQQALIGSPLGRGGHRNGQGCLLGLCCCVLPGELMSVHFMLLPSPDFCPVPRRKGRASCKDWVAEHILAASLAHQRALLVPFKAAFWLVSACPSWIKEMLSLSLSPHGW